MKVSTQAFVLASALSIALSVQAAPAKWQVAVKRKAVNYGDLNLQNDAGAALLLQRLASAAKDVCSEATGGSAGVSGRTIATLQCRKDALRAAVADVNHPAVTAMYEGKRHVVAPTLASRG